MIETSGLIAGILMALALAIYTFWPENVFASQRQKTRLDFLLERKEQIRRQLEEAHHPAHVAGQVAVVSHVSTRSASR